MPSHPSVSFSFVNTNLNLCYTVYQFKRRRRGLSKRALGPSAFVSLLLFVFLLLCLFVFLLTLISGATATGEGHRQGNEECPDQEPQASGFAQKRISFLITVPVV